MKSTRAQANATVLLAIAVLGVTPARVIPSTYIALGDGVEHNYNGIPFEIGGVYIDTHNHYDSGTHYFRPVDSLDLRPCGTAKMLHIIQFCGYADNVPDGVRAGQITVHYQDDSTSTLDLIVGVNTAEWAYDYAGLQEYLQHSKVAPAYSSPVEGQTYDGHSFYVSIALDAKPLARIELWIDPASYTGQEHHGWAPADWFGVCINGLTIEYPPIVATVDVDLDTLNLRSQGKWITAYLSLPEGYDVADIDSQSLRLNGEVPAAWSWIDEEHHVLMIKFDFTAVAEILEIGEAQITVTGIVAGDTKFEGMDVIKVIDPGSPPNQGKK